VTNPQNFFVKDEEILEAVKTVKHFKDLANTEGQGEDKLI
jgi:hypothetical protein